MAFLRQQKALVALVIASGLMFVLTTLLTPKIDLELPIYTPDLNYGVIVDCGSSGSRAHIFKWKNGHKDIELVRDRTGGKPLNLHIEPGLSSLKDDPSKVIQYMEPIMNFISRVIPPERHLDTPISFLATAGLRLLDKATQKKILTAITRDLRAKFTFPKIKSQVITGQYEGIYSWLSLNRQRVYNNSELLKSSGMIEVGGASTQVTFELDPEVENSILKNLKSTEEITAFKNEQTTIRLGANNYVKLFAATFLGLGVNSARESSIDLLVRDHLNGLEEINSVQSRIDKLELQLDDPCLTTGSSEIVFRPKELLMSKHQAIGMFVQSQVNSFTVKLVGTGNFHKCLNLLDRVLQIVKDERLNCSPSLQSCPMTLLGTDFVPFAHYPFMGLSEMFFTTNEMLDSAGPFNRTRIISGTERICSTPHSRLREMYLNGGVSHQDRVLYECFKASWIINLLHESGLKMPEDYRNLKTLDQIDGQEIDWTIGAIITEVALKEERSTRSLPDSID